MSLLADSFSHLVVSGIEPDDDATRNINVFEKDETLGKILESVRTAHVRSRQQLEAATQRYVEEAKNHRGEPSSSQVKLLNDYKATQVKLTALAQLKECREKLGKLSALVHENQTEAALDAYDDLLKAIGAMKQYSEVKIVRALKSEAGVQLDKIEKGQFRRWTQSIEVSKNGIEVSKSSEQEFQLLGKLGVAAQQKAMDKLVKDLDEVFGLVLDLSAIASLRGSGQAAVESADKPTLTQFASSLLALVEVVSFFPNLVSKAVTRRLSTPITNRLTKSLGNLIPESVADLPAFESELEVLGGLEEKLTSNGWLSGDEITDWSFSLPEEWLSKRKDKFLSDLRGELMSGVQVRQIETAQKAVECEPAREKTDQGTETAKKSRVISHSASARHLKKTKSQSSLATSEGSDNWGDDLKFSDEEKEEKEEDDWGWGEKGDAIVEEVNDSVTESHDDWGWGEEADATIEANSTTTTLTTTNLPALLADTISSFLNEGTDLYAERKGLKVASAGFMYPSQTANFYALYRSLVPIIYKSVSSPLALYNDFELICNLIRAQADEAELATELELMEKFSQRHLSHVLEEKQQQLNVIMDGAGGFQNCSHEGGNLFNCQASAEKLTSYLGQLSATWYGHVSENTRMQMLGTLLNHAAIRMVKDIEKLGDISEAESQELAKLVAVISSGVQDLFHEGTTTLTATYCQSWLKLEYLGQILESNLADIRYLLESGALVDYSANELVTLLEALFSDSERRQQLINDVVSRAV